MSFEFSEPFIKLRFEEEGASHSIIIDTSTDEAYIDGTKVKIKIGLEYEQDYSKPENKEGGRKKKRVKAVFTKRHALVIDVGKDGRMFILYFNLRDYNTFRGKPKKKYSYWNNGTGKFFWEDDLHNPAWSS